MSEPIKSAAQKWRLLSFRDDTPLERAFVDGILYALETITDPDYALGLPTAAEVEEIERQVDQRRADRDAKLEASGHDNEPGCAEEANAPLTPAELGARRRAVASENVARFRRLR